MERKLTARGHALGGGVIAGIIGGVLLSLVLLLGTLSSHQDIWIGFKGSAAPFLGARASQPGFDAAAVGLGLLCRFGISIIWGVLFAAIFFGLSRGATLLAGAVWGVVVWLVMFYVVLPLVGLGQVTHGTPVAAAAISHIIFGITIALGFLPFQHPRTHVAPPRTSTRTA